MLIISPEYEVKAQAVDVIYDNPDGSVLRRTVLVQHGVVTSDKFCSDWERFNQELGKRNLESSFKGAPL